jgi:hypothetical protein
MIAAVIAALIFALMLTSSASAECAWVLWEVVTGVGTPSRSWEAIGGGESPAECRAELDRSIQKAKQTVLGVNRGARPGEELSFSSSDNGHFTSRPGRWTRSVELRCLPQGTDPRGPKASGR